MIFKLFSCCIPVKGARRSVICDIQRCNFQFIPNILFEILTKYKDKSLEFIKAEFGNEFNSYIDEYFNFLEQNEFGFWCDNPRQFPDLKMDWQHPSQVTNAIIDVNQFSNHNYHELSSQLDGLGCDALQIRIFHDSGPDEALHIINSFATGRLKSIDLIIKFSKKITVRFLSKLCQQYQRLRSIIVHSAPKQRKIVTHGIKTPIVFSTEEIKDHTFCGVVDPSYFVVNFPAFTESKRFNNCLNRKIGIDINGEIKNCPSMQVSYGNIRDITLAQALNEKGFKHTWSVTKDQVNVCKDCEFRYICQDCRVYTEEDAPLGKPSKCKYDPYTSTWFN